MKKTPKRSPIIHRIPIIRHRISPTTPQKPPEQQPPKQILIKTPQIIGIILILIGAFVFYTTTGIMAKLGATFLIHGLFFTLLITNRDLKTYFNDFAVAYLLNVWVLVVFIVTFTVNFEIFFVIVLLGSLIVKELSQEYTSRYFYTRFNTVLILFLLAYGVIIAQKILSILNE